MRYNPVTHLSPTGRIVGPLGFLLFLGIAGVVRRTELVTPGLAYAITIALVFAWIVFCIVVFRRE